MTYLIEKIQHTLFEVEADAPELAIQKARDYDVLDTIPGAVIYAVRGKATLNEKAAPRRWPFGIRWLKILAKSSDRGVGDIMARVIGLFGGDAFKSWLKKTIGKDCGCDSRQASLNARWPL